MPCHPRSLSIPTLPPKNPGDPRSLHVRVNPTSPKFSLESLRAADSPPSESRHLGRARLTPAECLRHLHTQSCLYCGITGYFVTTCPLKKQAHQEGVSTLVDLMENFSSPLTRIPLNVILLWGNQLKSLRVLIDSEADERFLDATLAS